MESKVNVSSILDMSLDQAWACVRDFNGLAGWHPLVIESAIERGEPADRVGCVRRYKRRDGIELREQLVALDDLAHVVTYGLLDPPFAVRNYVASLRLSQVTQAARCHVEWRAWYDCAASDERTLRDAVHEVFRTGIDSLNRLRGVR
jgi:hypothetical protein